MNVKEEMNYILECFLSSLAEKLPICTLAAPRSHSVTFARNSSLINQLKHLQNEGIENLVVITPNDLELPSINGVIYYKTPNVDILFTLYANFIHPGTSAANEIDSSAVIHPSAVIGAEGISVADFKNERVFFRHHGNVKIGKDVYVGANAVVQCGRIDATIIGARTIISSLCVVGHNTVIGENCTMAIQAGISGTARIGDRCWIGIGAKVRNSVTICDDVTLGIGTVVVKDIVRPGVYVGNPAKFHREHF